MVRPLRVDVPSLHAYNPNGVFLFLLGAVAYIHRRASKTPSFKSDHAETAEPGLLHPLATSFFAPPKSFTWCNYLSQIIVALGALLEESY